MSLAAEHTEGECCQACGVVYSTVYWLPDDVWAVITPRPENVRAGLLCLFCAERRAQRAGIRLEWKAKRV